MASGTEGPRSGVVCPTPEKRGKLSGTAEYDWTVDGPGELHCLVYPTDS